MNGDPSPPGAISVSPFASLPPSRASPFSPASLTTKNAMAASSFLQQSQPFRSAMTTQAAYPLSIPAVHSFDRDANKAVGTPYSATPLSVSSVLIRKLPLNTSEESIRLMMVFSKELLDVEVLPLEHSEDAGFRCAILRFESLGGAHEAKTMLDGKSNISNDAKMVVEILSGSPISGRRYAAEPPGTSTTVSSAASSVNSSRQTSRFQGTFQSMDKISPPMNGGYGGNELGGPESVHFPGLFSPQSPIGNHLADRPRISGKTLIKNDAADDDETGELLKDPVAYAENGTMGQARRGTAPGLPIQRMQGLSLSPNPGHGPSSMHPYAHQGLGSHAAHANTMSPTAMNGSGHSMNYQVGNQPYRHHNFPPVNPADQNPPCNTLYVGNLPIDTSEEELKAMFSKQRGYKRLCFRTKQNGPMCFVEFEDISFATKALHELYGHMLHNSVKGGIRLSFSKNPLGVRSGQTPGPAASGSMANMNGVMSGSGNGFTTANGPPPGLSAPPGLGRMSYSTSSLSSHTSSHPYSAGGLNGNSSNGWGGPVYHGGAMTAGGPTAAISGSGSGYPSFMIGK